MATSPLVPGRLPVAVEDHAYMIEPSGYRRETVQVLRQQADQSSEPGEQSLNPQGLWRRSQESWHHGAGQEFLDGRQGDGATDSQRYRASKGIVPLDQGPALPAPPDAAGLVDDEHQPSPGGRLRPGRAFRSLRL